MTSTSQEDCPACERLSRDPLEVALWGGLCEVHRLLVDGPDGIMGLVGTGSLGSLPNQGDSWWKSQIDSAPAPITLHDLKMWMAQMDDAGSRYRPHIHLISGPAYEAGGGRCLECGVWVDTHDR